MSQNQKNIFIPFFNLLLIINSLVAQNNTFQSVIGGLEEEYNPQVVDAGNNEVMLLNLTLSHSFGGKDVMLTKIDSTGQVIWSKQIGDFQRNVAWEILKTDYGFLLVLGKDYNDKIDDWHIVKVDNEGNILDEKFFGDDRDEQIYDITPISSNQYIIACSARESVTNVGFSIMNENLQIMDYKSYGLNNSDEVLYNLIATQNNQLVSCGNTRSFGTYNKPLILSADIDGNVNYMYFIEMEGESNLYKVIETNNNDFVAVGHTLSTDGNGHDILVMKFNEDGSVSWIKTIGGNGDDKAFDIHLKSDNTLLITGETYSVGNNSDVFMLNIDTSGNILSCHAYGEPKMKI